MENIESVKYKSDTCVDKEKKKKKYVKGIVHVSVRSTETAISAKKMGEFDLCLLWIVKKRIRFYELNHFFVFRFVSLQSSAF